MSGRAVRRAIAELAEQGMVKKLQRKRWVAEDGRSVLGPWEYRLNMPKSQVAASGPYEESVLATSDTRSGQNGGFVVATSGRTDPSIEQPIEPAITTDDFQSVKTNLAETGLLRRADQ